MIGRLALASALVVLAGCGAGEATPTTSVPSATSAPLSTVAQSTTSTAAPGETATTTAPTTIPQPARVIGYEVFAVPHEARKSGSLRSLSIMTSRSTSDQAMDSTHQAEMIEDLPFIGEGADLVERVVDESEVGLPGPTGTVAIVREGRLLPGTEIVAF